MEAFFSIRAFDVFFFFHYKIINDSMIYASGKSKTDLKKQNLMTPAVTCAFILR